MEDKNRGLLSSIIAEIKKYLSVEADYIKLTATEKLTVLLSSIAVVSVVFVFACLALLYLSFALIFAVESWLGSIVGAFCIVGAVMALLALLAVKMKRQLIVDPIARFLSKLFIETHNDINTNE